MSWIRTVALIAARELRSYFYQPLAWVVLTALLALNGINFWLTVVSVAHEGARVPAVALIQLFFSRVLFWVPLLVSVPLIAMRLVAEERQAGTLETMLTAPVREGQLATAKYIAALALFALLWAPLALYAVVLARFVEVDWLAALGGLIGLLLVGAYLLAAALCASALSRNQLVAGVLGFVLVMLLLLAPFATASIAREGTLRSAAEYLDLTRTMDEFPRGVIDTRRILYPLSGAMLFLFVAARLIEASKGR